MRLVAADERAAAGADGVGTVVAAARPLSATTCSVVSVADPAV
ncbi:MAG: hypothetical protein U0802_12380 [Candidatus Binatia bacterium]